MRDWKDKFPDEEPRCTGSTGAPLLSAAIDALSLDMHQWSARPCETCRSMSVAIHKPFGCYAHHQRLGGRVEDFGQGDIMEHDYNPTLQTQFGENGNCLSACIASLFNIDIDKIPVFANTKEEWAVEMSEWMVKKFNQFVIQVKFAEIDDILLLNDSIIITTINSPDPKIERHAVISMGRRIIHDPMIGKQNRLITSEMDATYLIIAPVRRLLNR